MSLVLTATCSSVGLQRFQHREVLLRKVSLVWKTRATRGEYIFEGFYASLLEVDSPIHKLVLIATDGAPATTNEKADLIELCKKKCRFPKHFSSHFVIHRKALWKELIDVMSAVQKFKLVPS